MLKISKVEYTIDEEALNRELNTRDGAVGRVMAGFAGIVTRTINDETRNRAGGAWWPVHTSIVNTTVEIDVRATRPHIIVPVRAKVLVFDVAGRTIFTRRVNHPGSSPPARIIEDAINAAALISPVLTPTT